MSEYDSDITLRWNKQTQLSLYEIGDTNDIILHPLSLNEMGNTMDIILYPQPRAGPTLSCERSLCWLLE